jgi:hypothetical protein
MTSEERRAWNREWVGFRGYAGRIWVQGLTATYMDVCRKHATEMFRRDVDGCATLWRWYYRLRHGLPVGSEPKQSDNPDMVGNFGRMRALTKRPVGGPRRASEERESPPVRCFPLANHQTRFVAAPHAGLLTPL